MPLICRECRGSVPSNAINCPECGARVVVPIRNVVLVVLAIAVVAVILVTIRQ